MPCLSDTAASDSNWNLVPGWIGALPSGISKMDAKYAVLQGKGALMSQTLLLLALVIARG
jgi:hypothetical protein